MFIQKRSGALAPYDRGKIERAMAKAFASTQEAPEKEVLEGLAKQAEALVHLEAEESPSVERIQDLVEQVLMKEGHFQVAKNYILYREKRTKQRALRQAIARFFPELPQVDEALGRVQREFGADEYSLELLHSKFYAFQKQQMTEDDLLEALIKAAVELTTMEAPKWEFIAARLLRVRFEKQLGEELEKNDIHSFYGKLRFLTDKGLYGSYILEHYTREELEEAAAFLCPERDDQFTFSGLELLIKRYIIHDHSGKPLESPQEMYLGIALHLAMLEKKERLDWVKRFYDMLSTFKVTMATPTLANARKPYHQLSSCFIDTVPDSLDGIYRSIDNFAKVSKFGGGMGLYFGKVRATGSTIRGFEGAAGGVIRWIRLANDTAVAVDQLGMRQGAVAVYLDAWHRDLPEFLALRTNNGDDRMKAHDVFPAVCYPDLFWRQARDNIEGDWYLMCPHEIKQVKGYALEDCFGEEWERRYFDCVADGRISKRVIPIKELIRLIIKSAVETGTPFVFNRDIVNRANPNGHKGMIYCSNLCTEIAQNMSGIEKLSQTIEEVDGETVIVTRTKPGDFVVCNLASLSLGHMDLQNEEELADITKSAVRALDNVIDLNFFPVPYAKVANHRYRPIGLGVSGYHHMLAKAGVSWESEEHLRLADTLFEKINYYAIRSSAENAAEKGRYDFFAGSDWESGDYFTKRGYTSAKWRELAAMVQRSGMRNAYLLAVAPTSSTSILSGTTAGIDPIMNRYFLEEKKNGLMPRVAPELSMKTFWLYKNAHQIDQTWSIRACGVRQRHIDQAQSMNLYITNEYTFRQVLGLYIRAFEEGVKTVYYIRSKSLEVEECETCSS